MSNKLLTCSITSVELETELDPMFKLSVRLFGQGAVLTSLLYEGNHQILLSGNRRSEIKMKRSIFYLDDDPTQLQLFKEIFEGREYEIQTAATLDQARIMLVECEPEIIISDQKMPEISGADFLREAARVCPESFRIMLTGTATVGEVMGEVSTGIIHLFISKPWTESEMRTALERASASLDNPAR